MGNSQLQSTYEMKTTDIESPDPNDTEQIVLPGRLIGFGVTVAQNTRDENEQIMRLSMVYNQCNCVGSTFIQETEMESLIIVAGIDSEVT